MDFFSKIVSIPASKCQELGASIILPRNDQEHEDLFTALQSGQLGQMNGVIALDGTDIANEGVWVDSTGSPLSYFRWHGGEPNGGRGENYLHYWLSHGTWNDLGPGISSVVCMKTVVNGKF